MTFRGDESCIRIGHAPHNMSPPQGPALNLLGRKTALGNGLVAKRKQAGWDNCPVQCSLPRAIGSWPPALEHWGHPVWNGKFRVGSIGSPEACSKLKSRRNRPSGQARREASLPTTFDSGRSPPVRDPKCKAPRNHNGWLGESPRPNAASNQISAIQRDVGSVGIGGQA